MINITSTRYPKKIVFPTPCLFASILLSERSTLGTFEDVEAFLYFLFVFIQAILISKARRSIPLLRTPSHPSFAPSMYVTHHRSLHPIPAGARMCFLILSCLPLVCASRLLQNRSTTEDPSTGWSVIFRLERIDK